MGSEQNSPQLGFLRLHSLGQCLPFPRPPAWLPPLAWAKPPEGVECFPPSVAGWGAAKERFQKETNFWMASFYDSSRTQERGGGGMS